jgi:transcriptional regulator with XRE-family HTH domain
MTVDGIPTTWRRRRVGAGLTLSELARRSGVNKGDLSRIERGWPASVDQALAIARVLEAAEQPPASQ